MDFSWSEDQKKLRQSAVDFAARHLAGDVVNRDHERQFPRDLWRACADFGLQGMLVPKEHGGGGHDLMTATAVLEGVGYGARDNGLVFSVAAHVASCTGPIGAFGTDGQKREFLPGLAEGHLIGASAVTEPDSGSSALALSTTAVEKSGEWVLNGRKTFVTNAPIADLFIVYARTGASGFAGLTSFLIPARSAGVHVEAPMDNMGLRTASISEVTLENCRVPASAILGGVGSGAMVFNKTIDVERLLTMAPAIGVMERILERCVAYARERNPGGVPIGKNQSISHRIADMELGLEASRLLLYRGAWRGSRGESSARESALAKLAVSEAYVDACRSAIQIFGGYGYTTDYEIERELRDALAAPLYVGTSEIQRNLIAGLRGLG